MNDTSKISIVIPAKNEARGLAQLLPKIRQLHPNVEIVVVDDGSVDQTEPICRAHGAKHLRHPYSMGNGAAIKTGVRAASGDILVLMDADGQHDASDISRLLAEMENGYEMVVGARSHRSQANFWRSIANRFYNHMASWMTGHPIADLTSGLRAAKAKQFREFLHLLPNGFSYPTTITMSFFRAGYSVGYVPIETAARVGTSHINPTKDGIRFVLIIFRIGTLYSPLKLFLPISVLFFATGLLYYAYTYLTVGRFTNMSALLLSTAVLIFLIGLVSEQITNLLYTQRND